jgi:hypothetical protein
MPKEIRMWESVDPVVGHYIEMLYARLVSEKKIDVPDSTVRRRGRDRKTIDLNSVHNRNVCEIGDEWICYQSIEQLTGDFLSICLIPTTVVMDADIAVGSYEHLISPLPNMASASKYTCLPVADWITCRDRLSVNDPKILVFWTMIFQCSGTYKTMPPKTDVIFTCTLSTSLDNYSCVKSSSTLLKTELISIYFT